ncbi:MAG TPA: hypothetical protein VGI56_01020 [Galbitalea sp.]|jgi:hypothetical protein
MARVALALSPLTPNGAIADPAGTALVAGAGNGLQIAATGANPMIYLRVANASGSTATVTVLAGIAPDVAAISAGQGPVTATVLTATTQWMGPFDTSRLQQNDGSLIIESSQIVTITAFSIDGRRV